MRYLKGVLYMVNTEEKVKINEDKAKRLLNNIVKLEKENIRTRQYNPRRMVDKIMKMIKEEVECF